MKYPQSRAGRIKANLSSPLLATQLLIKDLLICSGKCEIYIHVYYLARLPVLFYAPPPIILTFVLYSNFLLNLKKKKIIGKYFLLGSFSHQWKLKFEIMS